MIWCSKIKYIIYKQKCHAENAKKDGLDNFDKIQVRYLNDLIFDIVKSIVIKSRDLIMFDPLDFKKLTEKTAYS